MTPVQIEEIIQLRSRKVSPKQIARKLGLRPAEVTAMIKQQSEAGLIKKTLPELKSVLINGAAVKLLNRSPKNGTLARRGDEQERGNGLAQVMLLRVDEKNHHWMSSYLLDCWCLGLKDTLGPRQTTRKKFDEIMRQLEESFGESFQEITLEQAQVVIYSAIDYARSLGLEPHSDFRKSCQQLGPRPDPLPDLEFGKDGQPFFIAGPYDDAAKNIATLRKNVGEGNFHYLVNIGSPSDDFF